MKKIILILFAVMVVIMSFGFAQDASAQPRVKSATLEEGDSTFLAWLPLEEAHYKWCRVTFYNPGDTITDSAKVYHVSKIGTDSAVTQIGFWKLDAVTQALQNDTVYTEVILAPGESICVLIHFLFPERLYFDLLNVETAEDKALKVKTVFLNE